MVEYLEMEYLEMGHLAMGYLAFLGIGWLLGLMGAGGSMMCVPVMVYFFDIPMEQATQDALWLVGVSSLASGMGYLRKKLVSYGWGIKFTVASAMGVWLSKSYLYPMIPVVLLQWNHVTLTRSVGLSFVFAVMMLMASKSMLQPKKLSHGQCVGFKQVSWYANALFFVKAFFIGMLTGMIGVGGGFMIVPALVVLVGLPMQTAVGTSLMIMACNTMVGVWRQPWPEMDHGLWLGKLAALMMIGSVAASFFAHRMDQSILKKKFGIFVFCLACLMIVKHSYFLFKI